MAVYADILNASRIYKINIKVIEVWRHKKDEFDELYENIVLNSDIIISQPLSEHYSKLSTKFLKSQGKNLLMIHNLYLKTFLPDCEYIGPMGNRYKSPLGDYYSQVIYENWNESKTIECIYNYEEEKIIYAEEKNKKELIEREKNIDINCTDILFDYEHSFRYFHVSNHPTIELLTIYLKKCLQELGIDTKLVHIDDPLVKYGVFPIYPSVQKLFNIKSDRDKFIRIEQSYSISEFVESSYSLYNNTITKVNK